MMTIEKSMIEAMKKRSSIRSYDETKPISVSDLDYIDEYINEKTNFVGPFQLQGAVELVQVKNDVSEKGTKLGTYGFIKNHHAYLVGISENNKDALIDFGYCFEKMILMLTLREIGTCWLGGTFNRNSFSKEVTIPENNFIPCITPIGYEKEKKRFFDKALRYVVKADGRKDWSELFFNIGFDRPLAKDEAGPLSEALEMVQIGPSASNKQPWRLLLSEDHNVCHFYIEHTPGYSSKLGYTMQYLDLGIAMSHFEYACKEKGMLGEWSKGEPNIDAPNDHFEYIATWKNK